MAVLFQLLWGAVRVQVTPVSLLCFCLSPYPVPVLQACVLLPKVRLKDLKRESLLVLSVRPAFCKLAELWFSDRCICCVTKQCLQNAGDLFVPGQGHPATWNGLHASSPAARDVGMGKAGPGHRGGVVNTIPQTPALSLTGPCPLRLAPTHCLGQSRLGQALRKGRSHHGDWYAHWHAHSFPPVCAPNSDGPFEAGGGRSLPDDRLCRCLSRFLPASVTPSFSTCAAKTGPLTITPASATATGTSGNSGRLASCCRYVTPLRQVGGPPCQETQSPSSISKDMTQGPTWCQRRARGLGTHCGVPGSVGPSRLGVLAPAACCPVLAVASRLFLSPVSFRVRFCIVSLTYRRAAWEIQEQRVGRPICYQTAEGGASRLLPCSDRAVRPLLHVLLSSALTSLQVPGHFLGHVF